MFDLIIYVLLLIKGKSFKGIYSGGIGKRNTKNANASFFLHRQHWAHNLFLLNLYLKKISWFEFCIRMLFFPSQNSARIFCIGIFFVIGGQICRSWAMVTCGESFNHYIQQDKKDNHVLVTHGMWVLSFNTPMWMCIKSVDCPPDHLLLSKTDIAYCDIRPMLGSIIGQ